MRAPRFLGSFVVAAAALGLLAAAPTAAAAPSLVTVRVTISDVQALACFEETPLGCGEADFYSNVSIGGQPYQETDDVEDDNTADPDPDWVFERQVDIAAGPAPVKIEIWDEDGDLRLDDDQADIDPTNGGEPFNLDLLVQVSPVCSVTGDATLSTQQCGSFVVSTGTNDDWKTSIRYKIEVIDPDTDGDWLPDSWEVGGLDADGLGGIEVDLPAMGADPRRRDLFLELDCLADADGTANDHTHCPVEGAVQAVVQAFADATFVNVADGSTGIQLHVDVGNLYGDALNVDTDVARALPPAGSVTGTYGNYGGGGTQIPEAANQIVDWDGATGNAATSFYAIKGAPGNAFNANRSLAFRYGLFAHQVNARRASNDCTSGWAEGGNVSPGVSVAGNDFIVSLGGVTAPPPPGAAGPCWGQDAGGNSVGTLNQQAGTLMHEFGHTLSLDHGGGDAFNNKPNYLSVMNYGIGASPTGPIANVQACAVPAIGGLPGGCDFSRFPLATLNEVNPPGLDECAPFGLGLPGFNWNGGAQTGASCLPASANVSANINGDFNDTDNDGTQDAGETSILTPLPGYDDWTNLQYDFRTESSFNDGTVPPFPGEADPATLAALRASLAEAVRPVLAVDVGGPADAIPGDSLTYSMDLANTGRGPALDTVLNGTRPDATTATFELGLAAIGVNFQRSLSYAVSCATPDGTVLTTSARATGKDLPGNVIVGSDAVTTTVHAPVLTLSKAATASVNAGEAITYRVTYGNSGSAGATSVVVTDTLPAGVYYSAALDLGAGPRPTTVARNVDGTTTLTWNVGTLAGQSTGTVAYTARPGLLTLGGTAIANAARVTYTNANGCTYPPVTTSRTTTITEAVPTRNPLSMGYWKTHPEDRSSELRARVQATDQRYDGANGSLADGALDNGEVTFTFGLSGTKPVALRQQLLATYLNLASRRVNAATAISSSTAKRLRLTNVRAAVLYATATLALPVNGNAGRYDDAIRLLDEINTNKSPIF